MLASLYSALMVHHVPQERKPQMPMPIDEWKETVRNLRISSCLTQLEHGATVRQLANCDGCFGEPIIAEAVVAFCRLRKESASK